MSFDLSEIHVLVPDEVHGVTVCPLDQLLLHLDDSDTIDDLTMNAGIDSDPLEKCLPQLIKRVRDLNATGDAAAYWETAL